MYPKNQIHLSEDLITSGIKQDIEQWIKELGLLGLNNQYSNLQKPVLIYGLLLFLADWMIIFLAFAICLINPIWIPFSLLIAGSKQRALSNLIHDSSHWNLSRKKNINDFITDLVAGYPMVSPVKLYRTSHFLHHRHLGHPTLIQIQ